MLEHKIKRFAADCCKQLKQAEERVAYRKIDSWFEDEETEKIFVTALKYSRDSFRKDLQIEIEAIYADMHECKETGEVLQEKYANDPRTLGFIIDFTRDSIAAHLQRMDAAMTRYTFRCDDCVEKLYSEFGDNNEDYGAEDYP